MQIGQVASVISALRKTGLLEQYEVSFLMPGEKHPEGSLKQIAACFAETFTEKSFELVEKEGFDLIEEKDFHARAKPKSPIPGETMAMNAGSEVVRKFKEGTTRMLFIRKV